MGRGEVTRPWRRQRRAYRVYELPLATGALRVISVRGSADVSADANYLASNGSFAVFTSDGSPFANDSDGEEDIYATPTFVCSCVCR